MIRRPPSAPPRRWWTFVWLSIGLAFLLSGGALLPVVQWLPGTSALRSAYRLGAFVQLFLLMPAGVGLARVVGWHRAGGPLLAGAMVVASLLETRVEAVPMHAISTAELRSPDWVRVLRPLPPGPVLPLPLPPIRDDLTVWEPVTRSMLQSLWVQKPLLAGYSAFLTPEYRELTEAVAGFPDKRSVAAIVLFGARYVVIDREWLDDGRRAALARFLSACRVVLDAGDAVVLEVTATLTPEGRLRRPPSWQ
jgi:hypothetical protein